MIHDARPSWLILAPLHVALSATAVCCALVALPAWLPALAPESPAAPAAPRVTWLDSVATSSEQFVEGRLVA
jgi:hypothetical protein